MIKSAATWQPRSMLVIGATLVGAFVAALALPYMFRELPNEMMRSRVLLDALHGSASPSPELVLLGNSIAMNGVDAKQLSAELPGNPVSWNLCSTGQMLVESLLVAEECPDSVERVVLTVFTDALVEESSDVPESKLIAYLQYGYLPSDPTRALLQSIGSPRVQQLLAMPPWRVSLASRWALRSAIDISCRRLLRKDLNLLKATNDLFFPSPYTKQNSTASIKEQIDKNFPWRTSEEGRMSASTKALLELISAQTRGEGREFCIVILPEQSYLRSRRGEEYYPKLVDELKQFGSNHNVPVVSFVTLLDDSQFIDHIHPNAEGAKVLTAAIAKQLSQQGSENAH